MAGASTNLRRIARSCETLPRRLTGRIVDEVAKALDKRLIADTGGDRSLSGAPQRMRIEKRITGDTVVTGRITPGPKAAMAMWSWIENGTGTPGPTEAKHTWTDAADPAIAKARELIRDEFRDLIRGT